MGAGSKIVMVNGANSDSVIWNAGGYAKLDLDSSFLGTLLARDYINVGAKAQALGPGGSCGGLFSALSYVSTGDAAQIGGDGCSGIASGFHVDSDSGVAYHAASQLVAFQVAEPPMWALWTSAFGFLALSIRRKRTALVAA
jgi:hypothetical protein